MSALLALLALSYLCGAIPFSQVIARIRYGVDLRHTGDGNVGAGNLMRVCGPRAGVAAMLLDIAKGGVPVLLALSLGMGAAVALFAGTVAVAGHIWPAWLAFDGGRGAAPALGVAVALGPLAGVAALVAGAMVLLWSRNTVAALAAAMPAMVVLTALIGRGLPMAIAIIPLFVGVGLKDAWDRLARVSHQPEAS
jgi:glycerol-3-phosphate acyltransferase PlsY